MGTLVNSQRRSHISSLHRSLSFRVQCSYVVVVILFSLCCIFLGCVRLPMPGECKEFFSLPLDQRGSVISTYSLEKQLRLYRCGLDRRPPDRYLASDIAGGGEGVIPVLLEKLETEKDELFQYGIIEIFEAISAKGRLRNRSDVVTRIRTVVSRMRIATFREMAQEDLNRIEKNRLNH